MATSAVVQLKPHQDFDINNFSYGNVSHNTKYNFKRIYLNDNKTSYESPELTVLFPKKETRDEGGYNFTFCLSCSDEDFCNRFGNELDRRFIRDGASNSVIWFGAEQDEELCEDTYTSAISLDGEYGRHIRNLRLTDYDINDNTFIGINNEPVSDPNVEELLRIGTRVKVGFSILCLTVKDGKYRPTFKVHRVKIIGNSDFNTSAMEVSDFDSDKLSLKTPVKTLDNGGRRTFAKYTGGRLSFHLQGIRFAPFQFKNISDDGKVSYQASASLDLSEYQELFKTLDTLLKAELVKYSREFYGKKKSLKLIENGYRPICAYSKTDQEEMKKGNDPKYAPSLKVNFPFYEGQFKLNVRQNGEKFDGDLETEITFGNTEGKCNTSRRYDMDVTCQHIWFGTKTSVKWVCSRLCLDQQSNTSQIYKFTDDGEDDNGEDDNGSSASNHQDGVEVDSSENED